MSAEHEIITRMVSGWRCLPDRHGLACHHQAEDAREGGTRETATIQLACALSQFSYRIVLAGVQAARDDCPRDDGPEYLQLSIAAIDVGAACLGLLNAIRPDLMSAMDAEMLMVHLNEQRIAKGPPAGELYDPAMVLVVWSGDVAREIQGAGELLLGSNSPDMAIAALERAVASCVDVALLGELRAHAH